eukprot:930077-Pelagomonas_calceolata.AAC.2
MAPLNARGPEHTCVCALVGSCLWRWPGPGTSQSACKPSNLLLGRRNYMIPIVIDQSFHFGDCESSILTTVCYAL